MYKYETHLHTYPVSKCAHATIYESLDFYKEKGYDGVFVTNHFIDGDLNIEPTASYKEKIEFFFSDYEKGVEYGKKIGLKVFAGAELAYKGTDFLIYGPDKEWYIKNQHITEMSKSEELRFLMDNGALVIQAHPFREAHYIDHIRLFPRCVHGFEVINSARTEFENKMANTYSENYGLLKFAGSDNHWGNGHKMLAGMCSRTQILNEQDFVLRVKSGQMDIFTMEV